MILVIYITWYLLFMLNDTCYLFYMIIVIYITWYLLFMLHATCYLCYMLLVICIAWYLLSMLHDNCYLCYIIIVMTGLWQTEEGATQLPWETSPHLWWYDITRARNKTRRCEITQWQYKCCVSQCCYHTIWWTSKVRLEFSIFVHRTVNCLEHVEVKKPWMAWFLDE
jgi:hypothetical protein